MFIAGCNLSDAKQLRFDTGTRATLSLDDLNRLIDRKQVLWVGRTEEDQFLQIVENRFGFHIVRQELDSINPKNVRGMIIIEAQELGIRAIQEGERCDPKETRIAQVVFLKFLRARRPRRSAA